MKVLHYIKLHTKAHSTMRRRMRVPWKIFSLLFFTLFMALGISFKKLKSGNTAGKVSVGQSDVPDVLPDFFVYICPHLIFCYSKKNKIKFPEKANILMVSGGKINAVHQTVALKSQHRLENGIEAELIHRLEREGKRAQILLAAALAADAEVGSWQMSSWEEPVRGMQGP